MREPGLVDWTRAHTAWENGGSAVLQVGSPRRFVPAPFSAAGRQLVDRPHQTAGQRVHAPPSGCRSCGGAGTGGVRFARPPAHFYDPYRGRSAAMAAWGARRHGSAAARPGQIFKFVPRGRGPLCPPVGRVSQPVSAASATENHRRPGRKPASRERRRSARTNFQICPTRPRTSVSASWDGFPNLSPLRAQPKNHRRPGQKPASWERRRPARTNFQICPTWPWTSVSASWDGFPNLSPLRAQPKTTVDRNKNQRHGSAAAWPGQIFKFVPRGRTSVSARWISNCQTSSRGPPNAS
jgi:hypothetical protein